MVSLCIVQLCFWKGTRLVPTSFLISTSWFLILAKVVRNNYVVGCSTARRIAAEENEMIGYGTVPELARMTQHSSTADWMNFNDVTSLVATEDVWTNTHF